jgi:UDP-glucuronate decarboxylase
MDNRVIYSDAARICEHLDLRPLQDRTVLVTGASGLIGTYFLASLYQMKSSGCKFKVYCQVFSDPPEHIIDLAKKGDFNLLAIDLARFDAYKALPETDLIIHAAGYAQPLRFMSNPVATYLINTSATATLLQNLRNEGKFLFLSSSEVYCGLKKPPFQENTVGTATPLHPRAGYIEGKRGGEMICSAFRNQGVHATAVRLGDIYGPGTRKNDLRALNIFIERAICRKKIDLVDHGASIRSYCYVADAVELMWRILFSAREPVYNLGGGSHTTIADLARLIGKITQVPVIFPSNSREVVGAPEDLRLDLSRLESEFGKIRYTSLEEGLKATIEWQRSLYAPGI